MGNRHGGQDPAYGSLRPLFIDGTGFMVGAVCIGFTYGRWYEVVCDAKARNRLWGLGLTWFLA